MCDFFLSLIAVVVVSLAVFGIDVTCRTPDATTHHAHRDYQFGSADSGQDAGMGSDGEAGAG